MASGKYNITIEQGATFDTIIRYRDSSGSYANLTGYDAAMQIRPSYADNTQSVYLNLSSSLQADGTGLNMESSSVGSIRIYISAASSSALLFDEGLYDLEIYSGSYAIRIIEGKARVNKEVTRI